MKKIPIDWTNVNIVTILGSIIILIREGIIFVKSVVVVDLWKKEVDSKNLKNFKYDGFKKYQLWY